MGTGKGRMQSVATPVKSAEGEKLVELRLYYQCVKISKAKLNPYRTIGTEDLRDLLGYQVECPAVPDNWARNATQT